MNYNNATFCRPERGKIFRFSSRQREKSEYYRFYVIDLLSYARVRVFSKYLARTIHLFNNDKFIRSYTYICVAGPYYYIIVLKCYGVYRARKCADPEPVTDTTSCKEKHTNKNRNYRALYIFLCDIRSYRHCEQYASYIVIITAEKLPALISGYVERQISQCVQRYAYVNTAFLAQNKRGGHIIRNYSVRRAQRTNNCQTIKRDYVEISDFESSCFRRYDMHARIK